MTSKVYAEAVKLWNCMQYSAARVEDKRAMSEVFATHVEAVVAAAIEEARASPRSAAGDVVTALRARVKHLEAERAELLCRAESVMSFLDKLSGLMKRQAS